MAVKVDGVSNIRSGSEKPSRRRVRVSRKKAAARTRWRAMPAQSRFGRRPRPAALRPEAHFSCRSAPATDWPGAVSDRAAAMRAAFHPAHRRSARLPFRSRNPREISKRFRRVREVASRNRSIRFPGPSVTRLSRARNGSAGWPSMAITRTAWRSTRSRMTRAFAALIRRSRRRSLVFAGMSLAGTGRSSKTRTISRSISERRCFVDDQGAHRGLARAARFRSGRVIPKSAGIRRLEAVIEIRAGFNSEIA